MVSITIHGSFPEEPSGVCFNGLLGRPVSLVSSEGVRHSVYFKKMWEIPSVLEDQVQLSAQPEVRPFF